jgi:ribosomal protein S18 acetylase RimI-like enzyme
MNASGDDVVAAGQAVDVDKAVEIRVLEPDEWMLLRAVRLRALRDSPTAFASSLDREAAMTEDEWRSRLTTSTWFVAQVGAEAVSLMCASTRWTDAADERHLMSVWVDPAARHRGVARALLDAVTTWARADGASHLSLWVAVDNATARRFYAVAGFRESGRTMPFPGAPERLEVQLVRSIAP